MTKNGHIGSKDPLAKISSHGSKALFDEFAEASHSHPVEHVITASANMLVNALRQTYDTQEKAGSAWDELATKVKDLLMSHYNAYGRQKGVFPYTQTVEIPLIKVKNRF